MEQLDGKFGIMSVKNNLLRGKHEKEFTKFIQRLIRRFFCDFYFGFRTCNVLRGLRPYNAVN